MLINGFKNGFHVGFRGSCNNAVPPKLKLAHEMPDVVSEHIQKELHAGRIAGPLKKNPVSEFPVFTYWVSGEKRKREV